MDRINFNKLKLPPSPVLRSAALLAATAFLASCGMESDPITPEPVAAVQTNPPEQTGAQTRVAPAHAVATAGTFRASESAVAKPKAAPKPLKTAGVAISSAYVNMPEYQQVIRPFQVVIPENEAKMDVVIPDLSADERSNPVRLLDPSGPRLDYHFQGLDSIMATAQANNQAVRLHALVFGGQSPRWVQDAGTLCQRIPAILPPGIHFTQKQKNWYRLRTMMPGLLSKTIQQYPKKISERYPNRFSQVDVVNEPVADDLTGPTNGQIILEKNAWQNCLPQAAGVGGGYIDQAFQAAKQAFPNATLFVNEIGAEFRGPRQEVFWNLIKDLRARQVPVDAVGFQGHFALSDLPRLQAGELDQTLAQFAQLGVKEAMTEVDMSLPPNPTPQDFHKQKLALDLVAQACAKQPACLGVNYWNVSDDTSWQKAGQPTLRYSVISPKPAYYSALRILAGRKRQPATQATL